MSASAFFKDGTLNESHGSTPTSGGTLNLLATSDAYQVFTGTQNHTMKMGPATGMVDNQKFEVINASTGVITVQDNAGTTIGSVASGTSMIFRITDISSAAGVWDVTAGASVGAGGLSANESTQFQSLAALGYSPTSRVLKYNPEETGGNYWLTKRNLPAANAFAQQFTLNGYFYNAGGGVPSATNTLSKFDNELNYWQVKQTLPDNKGSGCAFALTEGYVATGQNSGGNTGTVYSYNDNTNTWTTRTSVTVNTDSCAGFSLNGYGHMVGGRQFPAVTETNALYQYDPTADAWTLRSPTIAAANQRYATAAVDLNGLGYSIGGSPASGTPQNGIVNSYDISKNTWSSVPTSLNTSRNGAFVANITGTIEAYGGTSSGTTSTESYRDTTNVWLVTAPLATAVTGMTGGQTNSSAIAAGGYNGSASSVVESYYPYSYAYLGSLLKVKATPASIGVAAAINGLTTSVPVQVRTNGDEWRTFLSGSSPLKLGEALATKFTETSLVTAAGGYDGTDRFTTETYNDVSNTWVLRANASIGGDDFGTFGYNGVQYYAGGSGVSGSILTSFRTFNDLTNTWTTKTALSFSTVGSGIIYNGFGYSVGAANNSALTYKYNPSTDTWAASANLAAAGGSPGLSSIGGYIYAVGGRTSSGVGIPTTQYYSDVTNVWTALGAGSNSNDTSQSGGTYDGCSFYLNNYAYRGGNGSASTSFERFDLNTLTWSLKQSMNFTSYVAATGTLNGYGYSAGGNNGSFVASAQKYNPDANTWTTITSLSVARALGGGSPKSGLSAYRSYEVRIGLPALYTGLGGYVWNLTTNILQTTVNAAGGSGLAIQGFGYVFGTISPATTTTQKYNDTLNTASLYTSMNVARYNAGAFSLRGFGYVFHGVGNPSSTLTSAEKVDVTANTIVNITNPGIAGGNDTGQGAILNGLGYILGGDIGTATSAYNDSLGTWTTKASNPATSIFNRFSIDGYIYSTATTSTYRYNDATDSWSASIATLNTSPSDPSSLVYNGSAFSITQASSEKFNHVGLFWSKVASPANNTDGCAFFTLSAGTALGRNVDCQKFNSSVKQAVLSVGLTVT